MIVSQDDVREILRGELDELHFPDGRPPERGTIQAVQTKVGRRAACSVRILDVWPHRHGGHVIRFELAPAEVRGRFLRTRSGYSGTPTAAMKDTTSGEWDPVLGVPAEPEAVDNRTLQQFAFEAHVLGRQAMVARRLEYEAIPLTDRIEARIREAQELGLDASRDIARLEAGVAQLERRIKHAKQQRR